MKFTANLNQSVIDLIRKRHSVRTYNSSTKVEEWKLEEINNLLKKEETKDFKFVLVDFPQISKQKEKLGTYGFIKGAQHFLVGITKSSFANHKLQTMSFGMTFERLILKATDMDLGTCWMVSTFNRAQLKTKIDLDKGENFVIVSPIGYSAEKQRPLEKIMRYIPKSDKRKPWGKIFFLNNFDTPLTEEEAGKYITALEMFRLAPSAANKQPWKIIKIDETFNVFVSNDAKNDKVKFNCNYNDGGIAMCHFELTAEELELAGKWFYDESMEKYLYDGLEYLSSWKIDE